MRLDPPLDPSGAEGRSLLRRELLAPEYHEQNLLERLQNWLQRRVDGGVNSASDAPALQTFATMLVVLLLVAALAFVISRARRTARVAQERRSVLTAEEISADQLRARALAALAEGRHEDALVDAFRALTLRQVERGRLDDTPGATAHEVAAILAAEYPHQRPRVDAGAQLFDAVLYGDRTATHDQVAGVLALDDELAVAR